MARIRTIKPEFWRDEDLSSVSPEAALLAIGLLNHADDEGYFNANPKLIESDVFPLRELSRSITVLIQELAGIGYLNLFSGSDGKKYGHVVNFSKHQVINKPSPSKIKDLQLIPYDSGSLPVALPVGKERKGKEQGTGKGNGKAVAAAPATDPNFELFWEAYDYKTGRHKAVKAWKDINPDAELVEKIVSAALFYNKSNPARTFYKHPTTWLNGKHWEDDPKTLVPKIAQVQPQTQHQKNQGATANAIFGSVLPAQQIIEMEVMDGPAKTAPPRLG